MKIKNFGVQNPLVPKMSPLRCECTSHPKKKGANLRRRGYYMIQWKIIIISNSLFYCLVQNILFEEKEKNKFIFFRRKDFDFLQEC